MTRMRFKPWMIVSAVWLWPAVFSVLHRIAETRLSGWDKPDARELFFTAGDWLLYALVTPIIFAIAHRWPVARPHTARRLVIHFSFALLFCVVWAVGGKLLQLLLMLVMDPNAVQHAMAQAGDRLAGDILRNVSSWILTTLPFGVVVYVTVAGVSHAIDYFSEARDREVQVARMAAQLTSARYAALQAQLNPHFLFNTLNTVTVLVRDGDRDGAVGVIEHLSDVLRRTLGRHRSNEVTLGEELDLVRQYLAIEQARFPDRLRVTLDVDPSLYSAALPGFALQHLVENAIRHGIARREGAGVLSVSASRESTVIDGREADQLVVRVHDDGAGIGRASPFVEGHGLSNTRERLAALYGDQAALTVTGTSVDGTTATLRIPWRELPVGDGDGTA